MEHDMTQKIETVSKISPKSNGTVSKISPKPNETVSKINPKSNDTVSKIGLDSNGMIFGYGRVSTKEQNSVRQRSVLAGNCDVYFEDRLSGKNMNRPEFQKMLSQLRSGDTVKVVSIDRLGRNFHELINTATELKERDIKIVAIKENIDTSTAMGEMFYIVMALFAQMELNFIHERQREGIEIAKREGRYRGRPLKKLDEFEQLSNEVDNGQLSINRACKLLDISRSTFYRRQQKLKRAVNDSDNSNNDDEEIDF